MPFMPPSSSSWNLRRRGRGLCKLVLAAVALSSAGHAGAAIQSDRQLRQIAAHTPAPHLVPEGSQLKAAESHAARIDRGFALWGVGQSMEPVYAANTAVVVAPIKYDAIRKGMTVVYVKRNGRRVAHAVIGESRDGYIVQGVNNDAADAEAVNERNLLGVIVGAYASAETNFLRRLGPQVATQAEPTTSGRSS